MPTNAKIQFSWLDNRAAGVLLHPTSFPNAQGIGTLGAEAREFIDFVNEAGLSYWQMCPLGPTGFGDSPYQCFSAFAGNPYLIDVYPLRDAGLLEDDELAALAQLPSDHVDYGGLYASKWPVLERAYQRFRDGGLDAVLDYGDFAEFRSKQKGWLDAYAAFMAMKDHYNGLSWTEWAPEHRSYGQAKCSGILAELGDSINAVCFYQYLFFGQWNSLKAYASEHGVELVGDIPIFVALDSADIWEHPDCFQLNKNGKLAAVAGVPPDYFSETGQLWGNPLYNWKTLKEKDYQWWMDRIKINFELFDVVRLDHFRGFYNYWKIPAKADDARDGQWVNGPKMHFFKVLYEQFKDAKIIAEDLGDDLEEVFAFREKLGLPGMAILQFAFGSENDNPYLPENLSENSVIYTGTHDNDTTHGWYAQADEALQHTVREYLKVDGGDIAYDLIRCAYNSLSRLAIVPFQDFLAIGSEGRFNTPGSSLGNWQWRFSERDLNRLRGNTSQYLKRLACETGRWS